MHATSIPRTVQPAPGVEKGLSEKKGWAAAMAEAEDDDRAFRLGTINTYAR
jgi:hypothetical protein